MTKKYLLLSLDDQRTKAVAEIIGNKTANRIINFLSEKDNASEKDISDGLSIPLNTVEYNIRKMAKAGIVEESKNFFWSSKGKKIKMYHFSNKSIVISPKSSRLDSSIKQILPIALVSGLAAVALKFYFASQQVVQKTQDGILAMAPSTSAGMSESVNVINVGNYWLWFLIGAVFAIVVFMVRSILHQRRG